MSVKLMLWACVSMFVVVHASKQVSDGANRDRPSGSDETLVLAEIDMHLRVDLLTDSTGPPMVALDKKTGVRLTWELPHSIVAQKEVIAVVEDPMCGHPPCTPTVVATVTSRCGDQNMSLSIRHLLRSASLYTVHVRVLSNTTRLTSTKMTFFTSLDTWSARPIWAAPCSSSAVHSNFAKRPQQPNFAWFRSEMALPGPQDPVVSAVAFVSAEAPLNPMPLGCCGEIERGSKILGGYRLMVGNSVIGTGPGRPRCAVVAQGACDRTTPYDGFSLTISPNATNLQVEIHAYGQDQPDYNITQRVIFQLVVRLVSGKTLLLATGSNDGVIWEAFDADCNNCSLYAPTGNSGGRFGSGYWYFYPHENPQAKCLPGATASWNVEDVVVKPPFNAPLAPKPVSPISVEYTSIAPTTIHEAATGHFSFALPTEIQGGIRLETYHYDRLKGVHAQVRLSEQLNNEGAVRVPMYTGASYVSNFSLEPDVVLEHHEYMNWRFGEIIFVSQDGSPLSALPGVEFNLSVWIAHYPFNTNRKANFTSSSSILNSVWHLTQNSVRFLGLDFYSDSNARQRSNACQADATVASQAQFATSDELAMPRYQMEMIMDFSHLPGDTSWPYPPPRGADAKKNGTGGYVSKTWADWTVLPALNVVHDALYTGDLGPGTKYLNDLYTYHLYQHMLNGSDTVGAGLVVDNSCSLPSRCLSCLIDTSGGSDDGFVQSPVNAVVQAWVYYGMRQVALLANWTGAPEIETSLTSRADLLKETFNKLFVSSNGAVCDGICSTVNHTSIHSSFYALAFGLVSSENELATFNFINQRIAESQVGFPGGAYPIGFLLTALYNVDSDNGHAAFQILTSTKKHSWVAMMRDHSATTTMECWSPDELPNLSFSHIWSASPAFVIPWMLGGIRALSPGWGTMEIKPQPGPLEYVSLTMPTIKGPVDMNVSQTFDTASYSLIHFSLTVRIPGNTRATLSIPQPPTSSGCHVLDGVKITGSCATTPRLVITIGAGEHVLRWCNESEETKSPELFEA